MGCSSGKHPPASITRAPSTLPVVSSSSSTVSSTVTRSAATGGLPVSCGQPGTPGASGTVSSIGAIDFVSPEAGWAGGSTIWSTTDGGKVWQKQSSPGVNFSSLDAIDTNHVWVLGVQYPSFLVTS